MGYKQIEPNMTFAEASLLSSMEHNRSLKRLEKINSVIDWSRVEMLLLSSKYPPAEPEALRLLAPQRGLIAIEIPKIFYGLILCLL